LRRLRRLRKFRRFRRFRGKIFFIVDGIVVARVQLFHPFLLKQREFAC